MPRALQGDGYGGRAGSYAKFFKDMLQVFVDGSGTAAQNQKTGVRSFIQKTGVRSFIHTSSHQLLLTFKLIVAENWGQENWGQVFQKHQIEIPSNHRRENMGQGKHGSGLSFIHNHIS